jgi:uncharacterized cupin superfamily protein
VPEARLEDSGSGLVPAEEGWFVVNVQDAAWRTSKSFGSDCAFENKAAEFPQLGINISVLEPGKPNCLYHSEGVQEDFLVLSGECTLLIDGEERHLKAWDFVHVPAGTEHVFVGAGEEPCAVLMTGVREQRRRCSIRSRSSRPATARARKRRRPTRMSRTRGTRRPNACGRITGTDCRGSGPPDLRR